jgi:hypothetical protein
MISIKLKLIFTKTITSILKRVIRTHFKMKVLRLHPPKNTKENKMWDEGQKAENIS